MYIDESYLCRFEEPQCSDCAKRWAIAVDEAGTIDTLIFCFGTEHEARAAYEDIEKHNFAAGRILIPHSAVLFPPKTAEVIDTCD